MGSLFSGKEVTEMERNNVVAPNHYTQGHVEVIYEIYDILGPVGFKAFCLGNWIKYNSRAAHKGGEEDLKKAEVYLEWATKGLPNLEQRQKEIAASRIPQWCESIADATVEEIRAAQGERK